MSENMIKYELDYIQLGFQSINRISIEVRVH